ncbi:MAG: TIR domain-containing protein [Pseudomonadales bacterium]
MDQPFAAYKGDEPYVFVCYAHDDEDVVYPEIAWLHEQGINIWYDEGISAGKIWREEIGDSIKGASKVLYYVSSSSLASDHCSREINFALDRHKNVLPVYLEDVTLTTDLEVGLSRVQALHRDQDASYQHHLLNALGQPNEAPPPSLSRSDRPAAPAQAVRSRVLGRGRLALAVIAVAAVGFIVWQLWERTPAPTPSGAAATSIAVLPFKDMSPGGDQQWLAEGMAEEAIDMLVRFDELRVIARTSAFALRGSDVKTVGRELGVGSVVEGSVRRSGDQVRVTAQLIRVADGSHLWSARYDEKLDDIFAIQEKIARELADAIHDELGIESPSNLRRSRYQTSDVRAYELLEKSHLAEDQATEEGYRESIDLCLQALAIDPNYAQAHAQIGWNNFHLWTDGYDRRDETRTKARAAAERALQLDPATGAGHNLLAYMSAQERDWKGAEAGWERGLALAPGHGPSHQVYGLYLLFTGRIEEARVHILRAVDLDPKDPGAHSAAGLLYLVERNYQTAIAQFEQGTAHPVMVFGLAYTHHLAGDDARAVEAWLEFAPAEAEAPIRSAFEQGGYIGVMRVFLETLIQQSGENCTDEPANAAVILAIIGDAGRMFECLDETVSSMNYPDYLTINWHPAFDAFRDDPRFIATLNRLLPEL